MTTKTCPNQGCNSDCDSGARECLACYTEGRRRAADARLAARKTLSVATPEARVEADREQNRLKAELSVLREKYQQSLRTIGQAERELRTVTALKNGLETYTIKPTKSSGTGEATAVVVASDWHYEETVGDEVGGLNRYNLDIAEQRITRFFQKAHSLTNLCAAGIHIPTMVLALLGDFISNDIHEEFPESNGLQPMHAIVAVQNHIAAGIEYLLRESERNLVIPCHSGNHARTTKTTRFSSENGHSLEYLMYQSLAGYFRNEPRVKFIIPQGPHSYLDIYDQTIRFQHGHMVKYGGGVGGIYIPVNKAIAQWNKARHADLDVFGHFHQLRDGGNFICNGSVVGYNSFALSIKADYEQPKQAMFLLDKARGRTCLWPILLGEKK